MKVRRVIEQIEHIFGRQSEGYMLQLINDALLDIGSTKQHLLEEKTMHLEEDKRWYNISDDMIDITRVEILDTNDRYVKIPKLSDPQNLLRADTDVANDSLT